MKKTFSGYITVYLSLTVGVLLSLFSTIIISARTRTMRFETECVMDLGLNSIFAEYHRELLERYGLLFIDSSYGTNQASVDNTKNHLLHYMNINFGRNEPLAYQSRLICLSADNGVISGEAYASDNRGEVIRYQIGQYMKSRLFVNSLDNVSEVDVEKMMEEYNNCCEQREAVDGQVGEIVEDINSSLSEDEEPYSISNPADSVERLDRSGALYYAIGGLDNIPAASINASDYISRRNLVSGVGLRDIQKSNKLIEKETMIMYLFDQCGYYKNIRDNSRLNYQLEYIICANDSDMENLKEIAERIFMTRYPINMAYLLSNEPKKAEAEAMALLASSVVGNPELTEALKYSILFAWGYAESAKDVRIIFDGHPIGVQKSDSSWNTPLSQLTTFKSNLGNYHVEPGILDYQKYLNGFLQIQDTESITMRLMDIMEMDIRLTNGNANFKMDNQIYQLNAEVNVSSSLGNGFSIKRFYSYE